MKPDERSPPGARTRVLRGPGSPVRHQAGRGEEDAPCRSSATRARFGIRAINIEKGDELIDVQVTDGRNDIVLATTTA